MDFGVTPVPFHTGGAGAIRTLDKAYHRLERGGDITRLVSIVHGDSLADNCPDDSERPCYFNQQMLARIEAAFFPENPETALRVMPGTISVKSRAGDELHPSWTIAHDALPLPSSIKEPPPGPLGPNGEVQPFSLDPTTGRRASITFTFSGKRFIVGYIVEPGAGRLEILVDGALARTVDCATGAGTAGLDTALAVLTWETHAERAVTVRRANDTASVEPRVLAYHMDDLGEPNQLMHCNTAHGGTESRHWHAIRDRINTWWRLLAALAEEPVGVDFVYWNIGGNDVDQNEATGTDGEVRRRGSSPLQGSQDRIRALMEQTISDHATFWALIEFRQFPEAVGYSYPPLTVLSLPHDRAWDPPPRYDYRSALYEAASRARPTVTHDGKTHALPFPVDVYNAAWHKNLPGIPVTTNPLPPPERGNYVDPRGWTSDGIHYNGIGAAVQADDVVRYLVFPGLAIGAYPQATRLQVIERSEQRHDEVRRAGKRRGVQPHAGQGGKKKRA